MLFKELRNKIESEAQNFLVNNNAQLSQVPSQPVNQLNDATNSESQIVSHVPENEFNATKKGLKGTNFAVVNDSEAFKETIPQQINEDADESLKVEIEGLKNQVSDLNLKVESLTKERDESNDKNAQLCQLIEKLRLSLDSEKDKNAILSSELAEVKAFSSRQQEEIDNLKSLNKKFQSDVKQSTPGQIDLKDYEVMRSRVSELQDQLSERTKILKLRQQNISDLKKALQREILEHSKTQDRLSKLLSDQNEFIKKQIVDSMDASADSKIETKSTKSVNAETSDQPNTISVISNQDAETIDQNALQFDEVSHCSISSASVHELDFNDFNYQPNSSTRDVNHEYLKNVLFRYMTTSDADTSKHLVKALSVIMNFSPEQCSAIRKAMNSRSSWLRLR